MKLSDPTEEVLERICDAQWNGSGPGIVLLDVYKFNACNHVLSGTIEVNDETYGFIIENGDWNGTVVKAWGDPEDVGTYQHPEPPEPLTFIPNDRTLCISRPAIFEIYLGWRKENWFTEKQSAYNYDRHFQPGGCTEKYYREWAKKKGMIIGSMDQFREDVKAYEKILDKS